MRRTRPIALLLTAAAATITVLAVTPAHAVQRTHVSAAIGVDTNTVTGCTPVAPCRTFQVAMTVTDAGGEVMVLDSGGYGAVTITKSIALVAPVGVAAGISDFVGNGVTIATPGISVVLRGLTINGKGGFNGIVMTAGNKLTVQNCDISNLGRSGISVTGSSTVQIIETIVRDNHIDGVELINGVSSTITGSTISGNLLGSGIAVFGTSATRRTTVDITNSTIDGNGSGVLARTFSTAALIIVSIRDSRIVNHLFGDGIAASALGSANDAISLSASNNIVANNGVGISARFQGTKVSASGNTISNNDIGFEALDDGRFESVGNNALSNNGTDINGTVLNVGTK